VVPDPRSTERLVSRAQSFEQIPKTHETPVPVLRNINIPSGRRIGKSSVECKVTRVRFAQIERGGVKVFAPVDGALVPK
jgi:hypothetical protein